MANAIRMDPTKEIIFMDEDNFKITVQEKEYVETQKVELTEEELIQNTQWLN